MSWIEVPADAQVGGFDLSQLNIDEALLNFTSSASQQLWLYILSSACYSCPFTRVSDQAFEPGEQKELKIDTTWPGKYRFRTQGTTETADVTGDEDIFCEFGDDPSFEEFGIYNVRMNEQEGCTVTVEAEPVNIYLPLLLAAFAYAALAVLIYLFGRTWKCWKQRKVTLCDSPDAFDHTPPLTAQSTVSSRIQSPAVGNTSQGQGVSPTLSSAANQSQRPQRQRLRSLDAFRGICIVMMIFVNYGAGKYVFFEHAVWDGLTVADLIFPWFLWIMGVCIPIAVKSQVKRGIPRLQIFKNILIRSLKLIGLGVLYNSLSGPVVLFGENANLRIPGVLHRFGICYFICSTLVLFSMTVNFRKPEGKGGKLKAAIQDISILWMSWIPILLILLAHFLVTFFLSVPGCPTGYLGPGGLDLETNATLAEHCIGGAAGYIDIKIFTNKHIYNWATTKSVFKSGNYDPEGFLGTLTSVVQVWFGVQTGATMVVYPRHVSRLKRWTIWAILMGVTGTILCQAKMTGGWIPINKNLWSFSYVLVTSCFANILLSVMYFLIDIKKWWSGSPFFEPGMNSILLYMGHSILSSSLPWRWSDGEMRTHFIRLFENLWATSLWVMVGIWLHHKKMYWSV